MNNIGEIKEKIEDDFLENVENLSEKLDIFSRELWGEGSLEFSEKMLGEINEAFYDIYRCRKHLKKVVEIIEKEQSLSKMDKVNT